MTLSTTVLTACKVMKNISKWSELFVDAISYLECEVIVWDNRFLGDSGNKALVTLDGTDMPAQMKFSEKFMSHKFKGNRLKYEVGVCIATGRIVWIHGPSRAGMNDITLARQAFVSFLNDNEMAVADSGYRGEMHHIKTPDLMYFCSGEEYYDAAVARARHETVNSISKQTGSVAVITELNIEAGESLFSVQYIDEGKRRTICT
ncbi:hypothetical protein ACHAW5_003729 [Stephanodiscus triporus]|uniref:DDE Tnp4 domain-containing protein n=1 Tax=Stephanodiscus triporus TaxID=2934178 RepID=A0ABD3Q3G8_9STRA